MKYIYYLLAFVSIALLFQACASIQQPTGGEKDVQAPTLLSTFPKNKSLEVRTKIIVLEFDEDVKEKELLRQLLITPQLPAEYNYEPLAKRNKLTLTFKKNLPENTTYTFQFRNGVVDATEGNIAPNVRLVFSTGNYLDSGKLSVKITNTINGKGSSKQIIALYPKTDSALNIKNTNPYYYAQTDEGGNAVIENIKNGTYLIRAFEDKNDNTKYDDNEAIDWVNEPFSLDSSHTLAFRLFPQSNNKFQITNTSTYKEVSTFELNKGFVSYYFLNKDNLQYISVEKNKFTLYHKEPYPTDSVKLFIALEDSANNIDTVKYEYLLNAKKTFISPKLTLKPKNLIANKLLPNSKTFSFELNDSLKTYYPEKIRAKIDTLNAPILFNKKGKEFTLSFQKAPKQSLELIIDSGAIINAIDKTTLKNDTLKFGVLTDEDLGSLEFKLKNWPDSLPYFLEVYKGKELFTILNKQKTNSYKLNNLEPNNYSLKAVIDVNGNNRRDYGNLNLLQKGELVIHYTAEIPVKANWEVNDIEWIYPQDLINKPKQK